MESQTVEVEIEPKPVRRRVSFRKIAAVVVVLFLAYSAFLSLYGRKATATVDDSSCAGGVALIDVPSEYAIWGSYQATFEPSEELLKELEQGSGPITVDGRVKDGRFIGPHGINASLSNLPIECALIGNR